MLKGLIFDLDGCLIDSEVVQKKAFSESYRIVVGDDKCPTYDEYIKYTGESVDNVFKMMNLPAEMAYYYRKISRESVGEVSVNWDVVDLIKKYRDLKINVAICTGKDHDRTEELLQYHKIRDLFDVIVCSDDVLHPKPSPDSVIMVTELMKNVSLEEVILIGDGYNDIQCAQNAGVKSVLTLWYGDTGVPRVADFVVKNAEELACVVDSLLA